MSRRERVDIVALFADKPLVRMCAPMVRYSRLAFRNLVRRHGADVVFTPMIVSDSFAKSNHARNADFATNAEDTPLVAQFAASSAEQLGAAAEIMAPHVDGIDINCGCPQKWAMAEGYGSHLIEHPQLVSDMVRHTLGRTDGVPCSVKIRLRDDSRDTVELVRRAEKAGAAWISVHGRTPAERREPVHYDLIRLVKDSVQVPVVANGDIFSDADALRVQEETGVDGVMAARGMLANPAMFEGHDSTPLDVVREYVDLALGLGSTFHCFHHHLIYMLEHSMNRHEKRVFNALGSRAAVLAYLHTHFGIAAGDGAAGSQPPEQQQHHPATDAVVDPG